MNTTGKIWFKGWISTATHTTDWRNHGSYNNNKRKKSGNLPSINNSEGLNSHSYIMHDNAQMKVETPTTDKQVTQFIKNSCLIGWKLQKYFSLLNLWFSKRHTNKRQMLTTLRHKCSHREGEEGQAASSNLCRVWRTLRIILKSEKPVIHEWNQKSRNRDTKPSNM